MKLISFVVPSYNSQEYMRVCIESLLKGGEEVEIIIVDDGSKDDTGKIADEYQTNYPTIVKAVHQPNGGHGAGIAAGIKNATGLFFKIVDSDDWVLEESLHKILDRIREDQESCDLYVTDYTYYVGKDPKTTISFPNLPVGKIVEWKDIKPFKLADYLLIHSCMYRTAVLREANLNIPIHTFYEDDYFVYSPLCKVKKLCYLGYSFYCYYVGRPGQSVQKDIAISRYQDYQRVGVACVKQYDPYEFKKTNPALFKVMKHEIWMFVSLGLIHCKLFRKKDFKDNPKKNMLDPKADFKQYKKDLKAANPKVYRYICHRTISMLLLLPGFLGYFNAKVSYNIAHKMVSFN